jgi:hypothetical protein
MNDRSMRLAPCLRPARLVAAAFRIARVSHEADLRLVEANPVRNLVLVQLL